MGILRRRWGFPRWTVWARWAKERTRRTRACWWTVWRTARRWWGSCWRRCRGLARIGALGQGEVGVGADIERGELAAFQFGESGGGDHRCVIGGKTGGREVDRGVQAAGACRGAHRRLAGDSAAYDHAARPDGSSRRGGAGEQFVDHRMLKRSQKVQCLLRRDGEPLPQRRFRLVAPHGPSCGSFFLPVA